MSDHEELVCLETMADLFKAQALCQLLEDNGIVGHVAGDNVDTAFGGALPGPAGDEDYRVLIRASDLAAARRIVAELPGDSDESIPAWTCACGETVDEGFAVCWSCGADWPGQVPE